jgi:hypothetical protein
MEHSSGWNYSSIVIKLEHSGPSLAIVCIGIANPVFAIPALADGPSAPWQKSAMPTRYRAGADAQNRQRTFGPIPLPRI